MVLVVNMVLGMYNCGNLRFCVCKNWCLEVHVVANGVWKWCLLVLVANGRLIVVICGPGCWLATDGVLECSAYWAVMLT